MSMNVEQLKQRIKMAMQRKEYDRAVDDLNTLVSMDEENLGYRHRAAELCKHAGRKSEAADHYRELIQRHLFAGEIDQSLQALRAYRQLRPWRREEGRDMFDRCRERRVPLAQCLNFLHEDDLLVYAMRMNPMFASLDDALFEEVRAACVAIQANNGERVVKTGEPADCLFIVARGGLCPVVRSDDGELSRMAVFEAGSITGEAAFIGKVHTRSADLYAVGDTLLYALAYTELERLVAKEPQFLGTLSGQYRTHGPERLLARAAFFAHLGSKARRAIAAQLEPVVLNGGEVLFDFEERSNLDLYVVHTGLLSISARDGGREGYLYTAGPGSVIGELGVMHNIRKFRAHAVASSTLYRWSESLYREHYMKSQEMRRQLIDKQDDLKQRFRGLF